MPFGRAETNAARDHAAPTALPAPVRVIESERLVGHAICCLDVSGVGHLSAMRTRTTLRVELAWRVAVTALALDPALA